MSSSASVLLAISVAVVVSYLAAGVVVAVAANHIGDEPYDTRMRVATIVFGWPFVLFVAGVGYLAVRSAQAEIEKL